MHADLYCTYGELFKSVNILCQCSAVRLHSTSQPQGPSRLVVCTSIQSKDDSLRIEAQHFSPTHNITISVKYKMVAKISKKSIELQWH